MFLKPPPMRKHCGPGEPTIIGLRPSLPSDAVLRLPLLSLYSRKSFRGPASVAPRCIGAAFSFKSSRSHRLVKAHHGEKKRVEASRVAGPAEAGWPMASPWLSPAHG